MGAQESVMQTPRSEESPALGAAAQWDTTLAEEYIAAANKWQMPVDPVLCVQLSRRQARLSVGQMRPYAGCLLPLAEVLSKANFVSKIELTPVGAFRGSRGDGDANCSVLRVVLERNPHISCVEINHACVGVAGAREVVAGLQKNQSVEQLSLKGNYLGPAGAAAFKDLFRVNSTLRKLDVSYNSIGFQAAQEILAAAGSQRPKGGRCSCCEVSFHGNFEQEEVWNSITHGLGFFVTMVGTTVMTYEVRGHPTAHGWAVALYTIPLMFTFLTSALYHSLFLVESVMPIFCVMDHSMIFLLISGTYSPCMLLYPCAEFLNILIVEWVLCGLGIVGVILAQYCSWGRSTAYAVWELCIYAAMGWMIMLEWDKASEVIPVLSRQLLIAGGVMYTIGIIFFVIGHTQPIYHTIWHLFVLVAAVLHWFSVQYMLEDVGEPGRASWPLYERPFTRVRNQLNDQWVEAYYSKALQQTIGNLSSTFPNDFNALGAILKGSIAKGFASEL